MPRSRMVEFVDWDGNPACLDLDGARTFEPDDSRLLRTLTFGARSPGSRFKMLDGRAILLTAIHRGPCGRWIAEGHFPGLAAHTLRVAISAVEAAPFLVAWGFGASVPPDVRAEVARPRPVLLRGPGLGPILNVGGLARHKDVLPPAQYALVVALVDAGDAGLDKGQIEAVHADARKILKRLRRDPDWAAVVEMAVVKGRRYRVVHAS